MLILDMMHMSSLSSLFALGQPLDFSKEIDDFIGRNHDLCALELETADWEAISQVANWLKAFCSATTEMSKTKEPMLSIVHAIFWGLQDHIRSILIELPNSAPVQLRNGLLEAHKKLSEYYYQSDESPFYTWSVILDPHIMYEGLRSDCESDWSLVADLNSAKDKLKTFYHTNYANRHDTISSRQASLVPDIIRVLMLVKHRLRLVHLAVEKKDQHH
ncbi:hypothetical protein BYT27DRAFT_7227677 [Phlegmacium glaucopus]|nr:hypothetical protein BYT27DRAFT_7227677 [Phlegmacium glaucopus]